MNLGSLRIDNYRIARFKGHHLQFGHNRVSFKYKVDRGIWMAQLVKLLTSAQVMISQLVSSSPASGSVLAAQNLEPASNSVYLSHSAPPLLVLCL